eukprot:scaffold39745_cov65-Phaeocystis_antarctica.AAC.5
MLYAIRSNLRSKTTQDEEQRIIYARQVVKSDLAKDLCWRIHEYLSFQTVTLVNHRYHQARKLGGYSSYLLACRRAHAAGAQYILGRCSGIVQPINPTRKFGALL